MNHSFTINDESAPNRVGLETWMDLVMHHGLDAAMNYPGAPAYLRFFLTELVALFDDTWFSASTCSAVMSLALGREPHAGESELAKVSQMFHTLRGAEIDGAVLVASAAPDPLWRVARVEPYEPHGHSGYLQ